MRNGMVKISEIFWSVLEKATMRFKVLKSYGIWFQAKWYSRMWRKVAKRLSKSYGTW